MMRVEESQANEERRDGEEFNPEEAEEEEEGDGGGAAWRRAWAGHKHALSASAAHRRNTLTVYNSLFR